MQGLDGEKLVKLVLNGNSVEDWSPLDAFADKVIVSMAYTIVPKEDGTVDFNDSSSWTLKETTLTEYYQEQAAKDAIPLPVRKKTPITPTRPTRMPTTPTQTPIRPATTPTIPTHRQTTPTKQTTRWVDLTANVQAQKML